MKTFIIALLCLLGALLIDASYRCVDVKPLEDFNLEKFQRKWYHAYVAANTRNGRRTACSSVEISKKEKDTYDFILRFLYGGPNKEEDKEGKPYIYKDDYSNKYDERKGSVYQCSRNKKEGSLIASVPTPYGNVDANLYVLKTDYENYAAVYACWISNDGGARSWAIGLCAERECKDKYIQLMYEAHKENNIDLGTFLRIQQEKCPSD